MNRAGRVLRVRGTVQGVGFRPWVYRVASELGIGGRVRNDSAGVTIEAFGDIGHPASIELPPALLERIFGIAVDATLLLHFLAVDRVPSATPRGFLQWSTSPPRSAQ